MADRDDRIGIEKWLERFGGDPARLKTLVFLAERAATVSEVAERLSLPVDTAAGHLDKLREDGLAEVVGEALHDERFEPRYRAAVRVLWSDDELAELSLGERRRLLDWIVRMVDADIGEALAFEASVARDDTHASRTVIQVDEQGWDELVRVHAAALDAVFEVQATSAERLAEAKREGISALSALFCFELPPRA